MSYHHYLATGILLLTMAIATLKIRRRAVVTKLGIQYIDYGTSGGVYGLERRYCLMAGGSTRSICLFYFQGTAPGITVLSH